MLQLLADIPAVSSDLVADLKPFAVTDAVGDLINDAPANEPDSEGAGNGVAPILYQVLRHERENHGERQEHTEAEQL